MTRERRGVRRCTACLDLLTADNKLDMCTSCAKGKLVALKVDELAAADWLAIRLRQQAIRASWTPAERALRRYGAVGRWTRHVEILRATAYPDHGHSDD